MALRNATLEAVESLRRELAIERDATRDMMIVRFSAVEDRLDAIEGKVDRINGSVRRHDVDLGRLKMILGGAWALIIAGTAYGLKRIFG